MATTETLETFVKVTELSSKTELDQSDKLLISTKTIPGENTEYNWYSFNTTLSDLINFLKDKGRFYDEDEIDKMLHDLSSNLFDAEEWIFTLDNGNTLTKNVCIKKTT